MAGLAVFLMGLKPVLDDRKDHATSKDLSLRLRWVLLLGLILAVSSMMSDFVRDHMYRVAMLKANHQHFANVFWLKDYKAA